MKTFKQFLREGVDGKISLTFQFYPGEDESPAEIKRHIKAEYTSPENGVTVVAIDADSPPGVELAGPIESLVDIFHQVSVGTESEIFQIHDMVIPDVGEFMDKFNSITGKFFLEFFNCTFETNFASLGVAMAKGRIELDFQDCIAGSQEDSEIIGPILTALSDGKIDEFEYQSHMIDAGMEKYL